MVSEIITKWMINESVMRNQYGFKCANLSFQNIESVIHPGIIQAIQSNNVPKCTAWNCWTFLLLKEIFSINLLLRIMVKLTTQLPVEFSDISFVASKQPN